MLDAIHRYFHAAADVLGIDASVRERDRRHLARSYAQQDVLV